MTIEQLRNVHQAKPFRPFTMHMIDGRSFHVPRSEFLSHSPSRQTVIVYDVGDSFSILDVLLINQLEVHGRPSNGSPGQNESNTH